VSGNSLQTAYTAELNRREKRVRNQRLGTMAETESHPKHQNNTDENPMEKPSRLRKFWLDWRGFFAFIAVMLIFRSAVADWNQVPSGSMKPTILIGDRILVDKLAYGLRVPFTLTGITSWSDPHRGDV